MTDATNSTHNPDSIVGRITSIVALQHGMGVLSKRWSRANLVDHRNSRPVGTDLGAAEELTPLVLAGRDALRRESLFQGDRRFSTATAPISGKASRLVPTN